MKGFWPDMRDIGHNQAALIRAGGSIDPPRSQFPIRRGQITTIQHLRNAAPTFGLPAHQQRTQISNCEYFRLVI